RLVSSNGTYCRWGQMRSSGSTSSRTNASAQSRSSWYCGSVSKSHAIVVSLLAVSRDDGSDIGADDIGERAIAECPCRPMAGALADEGSGEKGKVLHVDTRGELAVALRTVEQLGEHAQLWIAGVLAGEDSVLVAIALEDRLDDQLGWVARHRPLQCAQRGVDDCRHVVRLVEELMHGALGRLGRKHPDVEQDVFFAGEVEV